MLSFFHRLRKEEEGQTLVLAVVSMLVLAMCVMATVNLGQATYERIRLQNTADATAYSLAATQARVFNFFAYTNRAMIAHYHSMLTFMAYLSYALYLDNTFGRLLDLLSFIPFLGAAFRILRQVLNILVQIVDYLVVVVVPALNILNIAYFGFQLGMAMVMHTQALAVPDMLERNDPEATMDHGLGLAARAANTVMLTRTVDWREIWKTMPGSGDYRAVDGNEARILMSELINASRHPWVAMGMTERGRDGIAVLGRRWSLRFRIHFLVGSLRIRFEKRARTEHGMRVGNEGDRKRDQLYSVDALYFRFRIRLGISRATLEVWYLSQVWGDLQRGEHKEDIDIDIRTRRTGPLRPVVRQLFRPIRAALRAAVGSMNNQQHHLYLGVTPYMKFRPFDSWQAGYGQPEYIVAVSKENEHVRAAFAHLPEVHAANWVDSELETQRGQRGQVDFSLPETESGILDFLAPGFNAISIGRAYYHRPGEWREQPNFFNPFWGAKLHPVCHYRFLNALNVSEINQACTWLITH